MSSSTLKIACSRCEKRHEVARPEEPTRIPCEQCGHMINVPKALGPYLLTNLRETHEGLRIYDACAADETTPGWRLTLLDDGISGGSERGRALKELWRPLKAGLKQVPACSIFQYGEVGQKEILFTLQPRAPISLARLISQAPESRPLAQLALELSVTIRDLHTKGLVHGSLRPECLGVTLAGNLVLADAVSLSAAAAILANEAPAQVLNPQCAAPEQIVERQPSQDADRYALGSILFLLFSRQLPFRDDQGLNALLEAHKLRTPPSLLQKAPQLPPALARLIDALLEKYPLRRTELDELISALDAYLKGLPDSQTAHILLKDFEAQTSEIGKDTLSLIMEENQLRSKESSTAPAPVPPPPAAALPNAPELKPILPALHLEPPPPKPFSITKGWRALWIFIILALALLLTFYLVLSNLGKSQNRRRLELPPATAPVPVADPIPAPPPANP